MRIVKTEPEFTLTKREAEVVVSVLCAASEGMLRNMGLSQADRHIADGISQEWGHLSKSSNASNSTHTGSENK